MEFVKANGPRSEPFFEAGACESVSERYERRDRIGEGTYGIIYRAWDRKLQRVVALKRLLPHNESQDGFPLTSLREAATLRKLRGHANVVTFLDVAVGAKRDAVFLVLEFAEHGDLGSLLDNPRLRRPHTSRLFEVAEIKALARMLFLALRHCHERFVCHRDVKVANLLYTARGQLKICDFGLARIIAPPGPGPPGGAQINDDDEPHRKLTTNVVTLWYRAPELLFRAERYAHAVDCWAAGCVLAEILRDGKPLLDGKNEDDQIAKVMDAIGAPSEKTFAGLLSLPKIKDGSVALPTHPAAFFSKLNTKVPDNNKAVLGLLSALLCYDPNLRASATEALRHPWFDEDPRPCAPLKMPHFSFSETAAARETKRPVLPSPSNRNAKRLRR